MNEELIARLDRITERLEAQAYEQHTGNLIAYLALSLRDGEKNSKLREEIDHRLGLNE